MKDLISVVIPIYKVESYLRKCIDSVISQTYTNIEIILVDDGSPDNCGKICDEYARKDKRIKVIHKENGGLSDARNKGIDIVKGKYIYFADSDDFLFHYTIEYLYNLLINNNADIAIGRENLVYEGKNTGNTDENNIVKDEFKIYSNEEAIESNLYNYGVNSSAWNKLYKTELFHDIRYPFGKVCEDLGTTYKLFDKSNIIVVGNKKTYNYLIDRKDSIMNRNFNIKRMDALDFCEEILMFIEKKYPQLRDAATYRLFMECVYILLKLPKKTEYEEQNKKVLNYLKRYRLAVIRDKKVNKSSKILCFSTYLGRSFLRIIWSIKEGIKRNK